MITIDDPETERLARELAARTGRSVEAEVGAAVRALAERVCGSETPSDEHPYGRHEGPLAQTPTQVAQFQSDLAALRQQVGVLPVLDGRHPDALLYDEHGLPG